MNKIFLSILPLSIVFLTGCEHLPVNNSNTIPSSGPVSTNFTAVKSKDELVEDASSLAIQDFKKLSASWGENTEVLSDNFFLDPNQIQAPNIALGEAMDFDNFFSDTVQTKSSSTTFSSVATKSSLGSIPSVKPLEGTWGEGGTIDFDNFFSNTATPEFQFDAGKQVKITSEFQFDAGKQEKIKIIKETTITTQKNNVIADQIRNKDIDMQLITDLANLEKNIPIQEKELVQMMKNKLNHKIRLLDAEAALKVAEIKMYSNAESNVVVARVEDRVLSATSGMRNDLIRKMLSSEPENYYQLKEQGKQLEAVYQVDIARAKLKYQQQIDVLEGDVKSLRVANKRIINNRLSEMEEQRIAEALTVEEKIKAKNQKAVDQSYPTFEEKILEYTNTFKSKLAQRGKSVLDRLNSEYANSKFARESARNLENRQYIADINQQIEQEQTSYKDKSTVSLYASRDAKINSIADNLKISIKRVKSNGTQALADLKSKNAREHQKQKSALHVPYNKKRQALNQKYQQAKSKILSRFRSEEYAVVAKIRKETGVANREIDARVKAEIKASLDSFDALQKEEAANKIKEEAAKKAIEIEKLKKSKESPGFFKSFF